MRIRAVFINAREQRAAGAGETVFAEGDVPETPMFAIQVMRSMADRIRELDVHG